MRGWFLLHASLGLFLSACSGIEYRGSEGKTALYQAAERGDLEEVRRLVEEGADVNSWNGYIDNIPSLLKFYPGRRYSAGFRPIHAAAEKRHIAVVEYLVANGAIVNVQNRWEQTPLALAAASHDETAMAEVLLKNGAQTDPVDERGFSPLISAAKNGNQRLVRFLASEGARADRHTQEGWRALHYAADQGHTEVVTILLANGADPDRPNKEGRTPLQLAVVAGHEPVIKELLEKGANPEDHAPETTPLLIAAAYNGQLELARLLLEHGAAVDQTSEGWTALQHAVGNEHFEIISLLIHCGADLERRNPENNLTPLQQAVYDNRVGVGRVLLEGGADPNATVPPLSPPLSRAAQEGFLEIVQLLVLHGADINVRDVEWTPLRLAESRGHQEVADFLREQGGEY